MTQWHLRSNRKTTGGLLKRHGKKKKHQRGRDYIPTLLGNAKKRVLHKRGGGKKFSILSANIVNVTVGGKSKKTKIITVTENPANAQFVRRNIITKGAIINTEIGEARVTSRPTQDGVINAVIVEETTSKKKA
jgi:small subunit ribosomal protein S8e